MSNSLMPRLRFKRRIPSLRLYRHAAGVSFLDECSSFCSSNHSSCGDSVGLEVLLLLLFWVLAAE